MSEDTMFRFIDSPRLLPPIVQHVSARFHPDLCNALRPGEADALRSMLGHAVQRRRSEFVAGRRCAARALESWLGCGVLDIGVVGRRPDRSPVWPSGLVGSITHTECYAAAAVSGCARSLGIDSEILLRKEQIAEVAGAIGSNEEIGRATAAFFGCDRLGLTVLFSAKESLFKCLFPVTFTWFDFMCARLIDADAGAGGITIELTMDLSAEFQAGWRAAGSVRLDPPYVHTGFLLGWGGERLHPASAPDQRSATHAALRHCEAPEGPKQSRSSWRAYFRAPLRTRLLPRVEPEDRYAPRNDGLRAARPLLTAGTGL